MKSTIVAMLVFCLATLAQPIFGGELMINLWINQKTGDVEPRESGQPLTDEDARNYIPQVPAAQGLYSVLRLKGLSLEEAMIQVLEASLPEHLKSSPPK